MCSGKVIRVGLTIGSLPLDLNNVLVIEFIDMLNSVRFGRVTPQITADFMKLSRRVIYSDGIEPTDL